MHLYKPYSGSMFTKSASSARRFLFFFVTSQRTSRPFRTMADEPTFYVSLPDRAVYLKRWDGKKTSLLLTAEKTPALAHFNTLIVLDPKSSNQSGEASRRENVYVQSCLTVQRLYREFVEKDELSGFDFVLGAKTSQSMSSVERQLYALVADDASAGDRPIPNIEDASCTVWVYKKDASSQPHVLWRLTDCMKKAADKSVPDVLAECEHISEVAPIFQENCFSPVFHDYKRTLNVLDMYKECAEVQELLKISSKELEGQKSLSELKEMMKKPLVVVEGMDATGKTTLTEYLEKKLDAARYSTPPPCLLPLRKFFDRLPEIVRRAYYSLGNYIVAQQIAKKCQTRAVVMDRYWHSTAAYGIANETSFEDLPPAGHDDYCWPQDLLKPTAVIFLTVTEEVRRQRLGNRSNSSITFEEKSLNKDQLFRKRLCRAYLNMREPACIPVDASGTKEEVVQAVLEKLRQEGIELN